MRILRNVSLLLALFGPINAAFAQIPDVSLRVAVRQKLDGKVDPGYHLLHLLCWENGCALTSVSFNQCGESGSGEKAFAPAVQRSSTWERNLKVTKEHDTLVVEEKGDDIGGTYVNALRFGYRPVARDHIATELRSFSGAFVKNSQILGRVITVEYVPLPRKWQVVRLNCGVLLPGLAAK